MARSSQKGLAGLSFEAIVEKALGAISAGQRRLRAGAGEEVRTPDILLGKQTCSRFPAEGAAANLTILYH